MIRLALSSSAKLRFHRVIASEAKQSIASAQTVLIASSLCSLRKRFALSQAMTALSERKLLDLI